MTHGSLFSGIGGFDLAAEWMGWENVFHCEIDGFCQQVLEYYWPEAELIKNIIGYDFSKFTGLIDVLSGGWPCQKYSKAGLRSGQEILKEEMLGAIQVIQPAACVLENVYGFLSPKFTHEHEQLCERLECMGYEVQTFDIDAASCEVPTMERHVWIVATSDTFRSQRRKQKEIPYQQISKRKFQRGDKRDASRWQLSTDRVCELGERLPAKLALPAISGKTYHTECLKALGNAIPPQVAYEIFKSIEQTDKLFHP